MAHLAAESKALSAQKLRSIDPPTDSKGTIAAFDDVASSVRLFIEAGPDFKLEECRKTARERWAAKERWAARERWTARRR